MLIEVIFMTTLDLLSELQNRAHTGQTLNVPELRDATWRAMRSLVFNVMSSEADRLGPLATGVTQLTEAYFHRIDPGEDGPREWARALAVVGQITTALYESMGPTAEVQKVLKRSQHARKIARILLREGTIQAKNLRESAAIKHQPTLARIIHDLARARIVAVQSGPGNTAWYRLTQEGSRLLKAALLSPADVSIPREDATDNSQELPPASKEPIKKNVRETHKVVMAQSSRVARAR